MILPLERVHTEETQPGVIRSLTVFGIVVGIHAYYARGRGFDSRTVQTFVCMHMFVCIGWPFLCMIYMYLQKFI
jgi:hypothetical protein